MTKKPKAAEPTEQEKALELAQRTEIAKSNDKTNSTLKRILYGQQGTRAFRGSSLLRDAPSDTAGLSVQERGAKRFQDDKAKGRLLPAFNAPGLTGSTGFSASTLSYDQLVGLFGADGKGPGGSIMPDGTVKQLGAPAKSKSLFDNRAM